MDRTEGTTTRRLRLKHRLKSLPVLPTLLTASNLGCGVTAVLCAAHDWLGCGSALIFLAMFFDLLDGKVARLTGTDGAFGAELDSLADVVSFGLAPAYLVHRLVLGHAGVWQTGERMIWAITVIYVVLAAIRLARYNVEAAVKSEGPSNSFRGLPSPGAAAVIASWVGLFAYLSVPLPDGGWGPSVNWQYSWLRLIFAYDIFSDHYRMVLMGVTVLLAFLMVTNIPFPHLGNTLFNRNIQFRRIVLVLFTLVLLVAIHLYAVALLTAGYVLLFLGPGVVKELQRWRSGKDLMSEDEEDGADPDAALGADDDGS